MVEKESRVEISMLFLDVVCGTPSLNQTKVIGKSP